MLQEDIKNLLSADINAHKDNNISENLMKKLDEFLIKTANVENNISTEVFNIYKKFVPMKQDAPKGMQQELFTAIKNYIKERIDCEAFADALLLSRFLLVKSKLIPEDYPQFATILTNLGQYEMALEFIKSYERIETNKPLRLLTLANFYNLQMKDYRTAIKYYEQYLKIDETKSVIYTIVASLYAKEYGEISLKDQIYYFEKAYKLKPKDRLILHSLAFGYEKLNDKISANRFYQELLQVNPTATDYFNYGAFLISCGEFELGHKYFTKRFETEDENLKYPILNDLEHKWNFKSDISDKTLLIHYEQGFGDTLMYSRFVPMLKGVAKDIIFVVQNEVYDLIKNSNIMDGIKVISSNDDLTKIKYDFHMALLDVPYVLKINSGKMPFAEGYLNINSQKVKNYAEKFIKQSKNIKVGIACSGDKFANYNSRDIGIERFNRILNLEGFDFYFLNKDTTECENITSLGETFEDFTDTACAIKNMDIIISTDNVILNLSGALGTTGLGLFNKHPNFRWYKLSGENLGWYNSIKPIQAEENNCWSTVLSEVIKDLNEYRKIKC